MASVLDPGWNNWAAMFLDVAAHGSSVVLTWGEDNELGECSWITGDERYSGFSRNPVQATSQAWDAGRLGRPLWKATP